MAVEVASKALPVDASGAGRDPLGDAFGACFVAPSDCLPRLFLKTCDCGFADAGVVFAMAW